MNSAVGSIFNIFKYMNSACTFHKQLILSMKVNNYGLKKKKEKKKEEKTRVCKRRCPIQTPLRCVWQPKKLKEKKNCKLT